MTGKQSHEQGVGDHNAGSAKWNELAKLLSGLQSRDVTRRREAVLRVHDLSAEELLLFGQVEARYHRRAVVYVRVAMALVWSIGIGMLAFHPFGHVLPGIVNSMLMWAAIWTGMRSVTLYGKRMSMPRKVLSEFYSGCKDKRILPLALTMLRDRTADNRTLIDMLIRSLPYLTREEFSGWTGDQKAALLAVLEPPFLSHRLTLTVLKALEQVGDASALPAVQKLTTMQREKPILYEDITKLFSPNLNALATEIKQQAQECLPYLEAHAEETRQAKTLLRASALTEVPGVDILLRPSTASIDTTPQEQLLRPR